MIIGLSVVSVVGSVLDMHPLQSSIARTGQRALMERFAVRETLLVCASAGRLL